MKTIAKSIALVVAAVAFTACTHQTIEPVSASQQAQFIIARPDTLIHVDYGDVTVQPAVMPAELPLNNLN